MKSRVLATSAMAVGLSLGAAACSSGRAGVPAAVSSPGSHVRPAATNALGGYALATDPAAGRVVPQADRPVGRGCASMPASGPGSFAAMSADPVGTAVSSTPALSTLARAVTKARLFSALNSASALTVFAPDNAAFAAISRARLASILASPEGLARILTLGVVTGRVTPAQLASGMTLHTLQGATIKTARRGGVDEVDSARVVCGNIQTLNATVYIIGRVLQPG